MSKHHQQRMGWAIAPDGSMQHVSAVPRGKACQCHCPDCGSPLNARQGSINRWHFQHVADTQCAGESALHRAAKQLLLQAAREGGSIHLPQLAGTESAYDINNTLHSEPWLISSRVGQLAGGREEVSLEAGLIADVLLQEVTDEALIVEIFVTHKKSLADEAKFLAADLNAIEIDLSMLAWDASESAILRAVLGDAPRRWLHNGGQAPASEAARKMVDQKVAEANARAHQVFSATVHALTTKRLLLSQAFAWPELTAEAAGPNHSGIPFNISVRERPVVTDLVGELRQLSPSAFAHDVVINGRTRAQAIFIGDGVAPIADKAAGAELLVFVVADPDENDGLSVFDCVIAEWRGIDRWMARLQQKAESQLQAAIAKHNERKRRNDEFAASFRQLGDDDKLRLLAKRLGVDAAGVRSSQATAWNTTWAVWQSLAWLYLLLPRRGQHIDAADVANDQWLAQLLAWPADRESTEARIGQAWAWLKHNIEPLGAVRHVSRRIFSVASDLPKGCRPWLRPVFAPVSGPHQPAPSLPRLNRRHRRL